MERRMGVAGGQKSGLRLANAQDHELDPLTVELRNSAFGVLLQHLHIAKSARMTAMSRRQDSSKGYFAIRREKIL